MRILSVARNFTNPAYAPEMLHKLKLRVFGQVRDRNARAVSTEWCRSVEEDVELFATGLSAPLWAEALRFDKDLRRLADIKLSQLDSVLRGGGHFPLLYFLVRLRQPTTVVETGVAAGFSSQAILKAIQINGTGHLYSSDFPLVRNDHPEQLVGIVVDEELKASWSLHMKGDRRNLPTIMSQLHQVDLFHYDSDKSYSGRRFALSIVGKALGTESLIVMDDIQDNLFFQDFVVKSNCSYRVFGFEGKYVGLIGL